MPFCPSIRKNTYIKIAKMRLMLRKFFICHILITMRNIEKLPKETNRDYALRVIKANLINLELKPGSKISEQDLADELKLSRTPVHEALQELARTRIVEVLPQRGSLVSLIDMNLVEEAVFMRSTIEVAVTAEACAIATDDDIQKLEENVNLQFFYQQSKSLDKLISLDNEFHELFYKITNKLQCHYLINLMNIHYDRFREVRFRTSKATPIIEEHKGILEAVKTRDTEKAKQLVTAHLNKLYVDQKEIKEKFTDFFA